MYHVIMKHIVIVLDNIRSAHNVGSILRTADGLGVKKVIMCGITPHPISDTEDDRLPHIAKNAHKMISKTALGAEDSVEWEYIHDTHQAIEELKLRHHIVCLEQSPASVVINDFVSGDVPENIALVLGPEVTGISESVLSAADTIVEIPMHGKKESLNVSIAAAIAMYELAKA